ncbi:MAG: SulP family inorganic anion transporter [Planctomycetes bacterium]|jgi:MFS superfamily sulfate permease-like transporter|nr:SulP family inorganic anion transporter [Planctomycetota bacterium]
MLVRFLPFLAWFRGFTVARLRVDFLSGLTVALVLIPQSMAYAQLANLPAYHGLYAAFLPPLLAAAFGSSAQLATGPVAVVSLMTATALAPLATAGSASFVAYAILLALIVGAFQLLLGVLRLGMVVNFLSHPVVNGFTNAAALIIATSQLGKLLGVEVESGEHHYETVIATVRAALVHLHLTSLLLGGLALAIMIFLKRLAPRVPNVLVAVTITTVLSWAIGFDRQQTIAAERIGDPSVLAAIDAYNQHLDALDRKMEERVGLSACLREINGTSGSGSVGAIEVASRIAVLDVLVTELRVRISADRDDLRRIRLVEEAGAGQLRQADGDERGADGRRWRIRVGNQRLDPAAIRLMSGGAVVGRIPPGLPAVRAPKVELGVVLELLPMAVIITILGFMEAISIAKAMAARTGQRLDPNQELIGQGIANMAGAVTMGYPVSGSFSRSAVNYQAGAVTGMSSVFSSLVVMAALLFLTPLLYHLPQSVLAAVIMMAVIGLVNVSGFVHAWKAQRYDGFISIATFATTLYFAPHLDRGILLGVLLSLVFYLIRTMKPDTAILSRTPEGAYRNAARWNLETCRHVAVLRFNNSLFFANVSYLEEATLGLVSSMPELRHVLIVGNGINELDASGEEMLSTVVSRLRARGIDVSISGLNDKVIDVLKRTHLHEKIGADHFHTSVAQAVTRIHGMSCIEVPGADCPLLTPTFKEGGPVRPEG